MAECPENEGNENPKQNNAPLIACEKNKKWDFSLCLF